MPRLVCALLVLALWRGPVPVCHVHEHVLEAQGVAALVSHIHAFHPALVCQNWNCGWHWHLVPVFDLDSDGEPDGATLELLTQAMAHESLSSASGCGLPADMHLLLTAPSQSNPAIATSGSRVLEPPRADRAFRCGPEVRLLAGVLLC